MLKKMASTGVKLEEKKWLIASLAAGIAILAAAISVLVYFSKKDNKQEIEVEEEVQEPTEPNEPEEGEEEVENILAEFEFYNLSSNGSHRP